MKKILLFALAALLAQATPAFARGVHYEIVGHPTAVVTPQSSAPEATAPAAAPSRSFMPNINFNIGTPAPSPQDAQYPQQQTNVRPRSYQDGSVVPTIEKYICTGPSCTCGTPAAK